MDILIIDDLIAEITPSDKTAYPDTLIVDCINKYAVPGLFDSHCHLSHLSLRKTKERENVLKDFLRMGITQVRDVGGPVNIIKAMKMQNQGNNRGPDIFFSGPMLEMGPVYWQKVNESLPEFTVAVDTEKDAERLIADLKNKGASLIKTFGKFTTSLFEYLSRLAEKSDLPLTHDPGAPLFNKLPMNMAIDLGAKCIEHGKSPWPVSLKATLQKEHDDLCRNPDHGPDEDKNLAMKLFELNTDSISKEKLQRIAEKMKNKNVMFCPTLLVFQEADTNSELSFIKKALNDISLFCTQNLIKHGVKVLAGVDGCEPDLLSELLLLSKCGLSNMETIKSATIYPARWLNIFDKYGSISLGKKANILIIDDDPVKDINNLKKRHITIKDGFITE